METTPAALPVPPLPEEQKAAPQLFAFPAAEPVWLAEARRRDKQTSDFTSITATDRRALLAAYDAAMAENARLSLLLEEERRTVASLRERNSMLGGSLDDERRDTAELVKEFGELRGKVTSLLEDLANGCEPAVAGLISDASEEWKAINRERANNLRFLELKAKELGIEWPIKPIPYKGNLPSEPAPICQRDCQKCDKAASSLPLPGTLGSAAVVLDSAAGLQGEEGGGHV